MPGVSACVWVTDAIQGSQTGKRCSHNLYTIDWKLYRVHCISSNGWGGEYFPYMHREIGKTFAPFACAALRKLQFLNVSPSPSLSPFISASPAIFRSRMRRQIASALRSGQFSILAEKLRKNWYSFSVVDMRRAIVATGARASAMNHNESRTHSRTRAACAAAPTRKCSHTHDRALHFTYTRARASRKVRINHSLTLHFVTTYTHTCSANHARTLSQCR